MLDTTSPPKAHILNQPDAPSLAERLFATRDRSMELAAPLTPEDMVVQAMEDASPTKWHLAHVTWFFETFVLKPYLPGYRIFDDSFNFCFNSYYESQGARHPRPKRGLLTRPSIECVMAYRAHVDEGLRTLFEQRADMAPDVARLIEIGINHEEQHQELLLSDILALFDANPLRPAYQEAADINDTEPQLPVRWITHGGGIVKIGHSGEGYSWDNENPAHEALIHPFAIASRLTTNAEWLEFILDDGYRTPSLWLADGWTTVNREGWNAPLYWHQSDGGWMQMSLQGSRPVSPAEPVAHLSFYEAEAFARWSGKRLPTEFEWEFAAKAAGEMKNGARSGALRPHRTPDTGSANAPQQLFGDLWQWTASAYLPYPGYRPPLGAIGEYNGKFMVSQHVLRGSSYATPPDHSRTTYRNFFYPHQRWQFAGLRLASDHV